MRIEVRYKLKYQFRGHNFELAKMNVNRLQWRRIVIIKYILSENTFSLRSSSDQDVKEFMLSSQQNCTKIK